VRSGPERGSTGGEALSGEAQQPHIRQQRIMLRMPRPPAGIAPVMWVFVVVVMENS
jgi:hypothetical protein